MGLEAQCVCRWDGGEGEIKALLEARELILRGTLRRTFPIAALYEVATENGCLSFRVNGDHFSLALGDERAARWAAKIATPPPSLARKLGIDGGMKIWVIGEIGDPVLIEALKGARATLAANAGLTLAVVLDAAALDQAVHQHQEQAMPGPIWLVYTKGPRSTFGETAVRKHMRASGYIDTKVSAISDILSATRYARRME